MSIEQLVETITKEVLRQVKTSGRPVENLILANREDDSVRPLLERLGPNACVSYWDPSEQTPTAKRVILPRMTCAQMADLASGRASDAVTAQVLSLLLRGAIVEVFAFEYRRYVNTAPAPLFALYEAHVASLKSFGLKAFDECEEKIGCLKQLLITESDIIAAHKQGITLLEVSAAAQLTPLAKDSARERGLKICHSERRNQ